MYFKLSIYSLFLLSCEFRNVFPRSVLCVPNSSPDTQLRLASHTVDLEFGMHVEPGSCLPSYINQKQKTKCTELAIFL